MATSHPKEAVVSLAAQFLIQKIHAGANPVPGSASITESLELAHAVLDAADEFDAVLEQREIDAKIAADKKEEADRLARLDAEAQAEVARKVTEAAAKTKAAGAPAS